MNKVAYMDEEILKFQMAENSKLIDKFLKEFNESISQLTSSEKARA